MDRFFHSELTTLRAHITQMGSMAADAVSKATRALLENDVDLAESVIANDYAIDELEIAIDQEATRYLSLRAPVATDLRIITVALKASHDLERVGDEAKSVAKKTRRVLNRDGVCKELFHFVQLTEKAEAMIRRAMLSFIEEDPEQARTILTDDEEIDRLNKRNVRALVEAAKDAPEKIDSVVDLIFASKSLERIADHATNLAEEVIYFTTAEDARHQRHDDPPAKS